MCGFPGLWSEKASYPQVWRVAKVIHIPKARPTKFGNDAIRYATAPPKIIRRTMPSMERFPTP